MRILALDHGTARCGCAISDPSGTLARPLDVIEPPDSSRVAELVAKLGAELVVVGLPVGLGGEEGEQAALARAFAGEIEALVEVPVETYDERFTTALAQASARSGAGAAEDSLAAAHLLESYLEAQGERTLSEQPPNGPDDPFLSEDPAARERERRRLEREQRRAKREAKQAGRTGPSAGEKASAALSGLSDRISKRRSAGSDPKTSSAEPDADVSGGSDPSVPSVDPAESPAPVSEPLSYSRSTPPPASTGFLSRLPRPSPVWIVAIVFLVAVLLFLNALFQPFHDEDGKKVLFKIPKGAGAGQVADSLDEQGVISSGTLFEIRLTLAGHRNDLFAGAYALQEDMSYSDVITELTKPPSQRTVAITIPEGLGREQIAKISTGAGLEGSYEKASKSSKELDPADYGAEGAPSLEGFLYPSSYELKAKATAEDLVDAQLAAFKKEFKKVDLSFAKSKGRTAYEVLIIASMIDREVMVADERKLVSSVIWNRLASGEPLGIDATIRYATGNYDQPLLQSELEEDTPYNTRINPDLPPTPIGNPGLDAIQAAANPADTKYRAYVVKPGTCGEHTFSVTEEERIAAEARYNQAREAAGGKSPDTC